MKLKYDYFLTVAELKDKLNQYPDDAKILVQRVEDRYYEGIDISGMHGIYTNENGEQVCGILPSGSKSTPWETINHIDYDGYEDQYTPVWCVSKKKDDPDNLYLNLHY